MHLMSFIQLWCSSQISSWSSCLPRAAVPLQPSALWLCQRQPQPCLAAAVGLHMVPVTQVLTGGSVWPPCLHCWSQNTAGPAEPSLMSRLSCLASSCFPKNKGRSCKPLSTCQAHEGVAATVRYLKLEMHMFRKMNSTQMS